MRFLVLALLSTMVCITSAAYADCATMVSPPQSFDRSNWSELEGLTADSNLSSDITAVEELGSWGQGDLNIDQYSITLDASGQSAAELLADVRGKFNELVFAGSAEQSFRAYSDDNETLWASDDPTGAVMVFSLKDFPGYDVFGVPVLPAVSLEDAAVVVSCFSPTSFVFSTIQLGSMLLPNDPGLHPVAGNRAFGVRDNGDDSLTFFVKAADRIVNSGMFAVIDTLSDERAKAAREQIFERGHEVWIGLLANIEAEYASRNPRDEGVFSQRVPF